MKTRTLVIFLAILAGRAALAQSHRYPVEDFHHRSITLPVDHLSGSEETFTLYYELSGNFTFDQPTIIFVTDGQQSYGEAGKVDELARRMQFDSTLNLVFIENRGRRYSFIDASNADGSSDWEKVYRLFSAEQMVEDIECVRKDLFKDHPGSQLFLFARSGGGYIAQEYLAKYGLHVQRAYLQCAPNPTIMKQLGNPESRSFINTVRAADPALPGMLEAVLKKRTVPELHLLWLLYRIQFAVQKPEPVFLRIINDLAHDSLGSYNEYLRKGGFDYTKAKGTQTSLAKQMGPAMFMSPIQCDGEYMLGDPPDYIDPVYTCLGDLCAPIIQLVREKKVPPPEPPVLEEFGRLATEVFYQAGYTDHITPYEVGLELGKYFRHYELFIADDNHMMMKHEACYPPMRNAFFKHGIGSTELQEARASANCGEWKPE